MLADLISNTARNYLASTNNPDQWLIDWVNQGQATSSGEHITEENALNCGSVKAAVSCLSEAMMTLGIEICRQAKSDKIEVAADHELLPILARSPNPETTSITWRDQQQNHLGTWGNGYSWIQRTIRGNKIVALWSRSPKAERTKPIRSKDDGKLYYELHDDAGQLEDLVPAENMLHLKYLTLDGVIGKSPVRMIRESIGGDRAAERLANEIFKNGDMSMGYFRHPGKLSEQAYARLKKSLAENSEHGGRHRKHILEEGMEFEGTSYSVEQMQMLNARLFLLRSVARAYRISPAVLFDLEAGGVDITRLGWQFVTFTLLPWCERWTSEINAKLLVWPYFCRFNFSKFLSADPNARSARQRTLFSVGALSVNEIRHEEGYNHLDDKNADEHFVPLNMIPLSKADEMGMKPSPTGGDPNKPKPGAPTGGDGVTPGEFQPAVGEKEAKDVGGQRSEVGAQLLTSVEPLVANNLALIHADLVVADALARMGRIEASEALRAAKDPKTFLARLDAFYAGHIETMREALANPIRTVMLLREGPYSGGVFTDWEVNRTVDEHVAGKRAALLAASECKPSELPGRVAECVKDWAKP